MLASFLPDPLHPAVVHLPIAPSVTLPPTAPAAARDAAGRNGEDAR
jgi:hypothetical protein